MRCVKLQNVHNSGQIRLKQWIYGGFLKFWLFWQSHTLNKCKIMKTAQDRDKATADL